MTELRGYTVVITGAAQGVGLAMATACAEEGANLALIGSKQSENKMGDVITALKEHADNTNIHYFVADLTDDNSIQDSLTNIVNHYGAIDVLINNASVILPGQVQGTAMAQYDLMHNINMRAPYVLSKFAYQYLNKSDHIPQIINIAPPMNLDPKCLAKHCAYTSSRYALSLYTVALSEEYRDQITVNALWPKCTIDASDSCNIIAGTYEKISNSKRSPNIMADALIYMITEAKYDKTGEFIIDEELLNEYDVDLSVYQNDGAMLQKETFC